MIKLRPATINDLDILQYWDTKQHVRDSDGDEDWNWETELNRHTTWREQLIAERDEVPIGMVQIIDPFEEETHYWGKIEQNKRAIDIWIGEEENLGKGYGTEIGGFEKAMDLDKTKAAEKTKPEHRLSM